MTHNIFSLAASTMRDYFKLALKSRVHATIYAVLVTLIITAIASPFFMPIIGSRSSSAAGPVAAIPAKPVPQPANSSTPPPKTASARMPIRKSSVTQIALGDQSSNINDVSHDVAINYGATAGEKKTEASEGKK